MPSLCESFRNEAGFVWNGMKKAAALGMPLSEETLTEYVLYKIALAHVDTRSLQHYLGHKNIQHTVRYSELSPDRFRDFWKPASGATAPHKFGTGSDRGHMSRPQKPPELGADRSGPAPLAAPGEGEGAY